MGERMCCNFWQKGNATYFCSLPEGHDGSCVPDDADQEQRSPPEPSVEQELPWTPPEQDGRSLEDHIHGSVLLLSWLSESARSTIATCVARHLRNVGLDPFTALQERDRLREALRERLESTRKAWQLHRTRPGCSNLGEPCRDRENGCAHCRHSRLLETSDE